MPLLLLPTDQHNMIVTACKVVQWYGQQQPGCTMLGLSISALIPFCMSCLNSLCVCGAASITNLGRICQTEACRVQRRREVGWQVCYDPRWFS